MAYGFRLDLAHGGAQQIVEIRPRRGARLTQGRQHFAAVDGQEAAADNLRGFWVFDPCEDDGNGCSAGDQCCGGYCEPDAQGQKVCTSIPPACGGEYDQCGNGTSCCTGLTCIDGKCASVIQ